MSDRSNQTSCPGRFEDSVIVVTGSTRGIGRGIARRFATEGASVVITGRDAESGATVASSIREDGGDALFVETDLRDLEEIQALFRATADKYGAVDVLINNAGVQTETSVTEATLDDWEFVLETNFRAYWLCAKHAAEHMVEGTIINISSNHAFLTMPSHFPYNAVKAGINGMTRAMALDLGPEIRVNTISPGWIEVERTREELPEERRGQLESIHPLGRIGQPEDVAGAVAFLASDDAAFVTGSNLLVDGGRTAVMQDDTLPDYRRDQD